MQQMSTLPLLFHGLFLLFCEAIQTPFFEREPPRSAVWEPLENPLYHHHHRLIMLIREKL